MCGLPHSPVGGAARVQVSPRSSRSLSGTEGPEVTEMLQNMFSLDRFDVFALQQMTDGRCGRKGWLPAAHAQPGRPLRWRLGRQGCSPGPHAHIALEPRDAHLMIAAAGSGWWWEAASTGPEGLEWQQTRDPPPCACAPAATCRALETVGLGLLQQLGLVADLHLPQDKLQVSGRARRGAARAMAAAAAATAPARRAQHGRQAPPPQPARPACPRAHAAARHPG
jgi:hypothetical protein